MYGLFSRLTYKTEGLDEGKSWFEEQNYCSVINPSSKQEPYVSFVLNYSQGLVNIQSLPQKNDR